jgi:quinol monooxygenase YgiN
MVTVILSHEVKDFAQWKTGFDSHETTRAAAGVKTTGVYTSVDNPNMVTVTTEFPSAEAVHGFVNSPDLKAAMEKGGVIGAPEVKILNRM